MQVQQQRSLLNDINLRMEIQQKIIDILNKGLEENQKIKFEDLDAFNRDEKHIENVKKAYKIEEREAKQHKILNDLCDEFPDKKLLGSVNRYAFCFINPDPKDDEEKEANKKVFFDFCDNHKIINFADKYAKIAFNYNLVETSPVNETEGIDMYEKDPQAYEVFHQIGRLFGGEDGTSIHPALSKIFKHNVSAFEYLCNCKQSFVVLKNPMNLLIPDSLMDPTMYGNYMTKVSEIQNLLKEYNDVKEFQSPNLDRDVFEYGSAALEVTGFYLQSKKVKELAADNKISPDFTKTKTFVKDGMPVKFGTALNDIIEGRKGYEVKEIDEASKDRFKAALNENIAFVNENNLPIYNKLFDDIQKSNADFKGSKGFFTRDSKQFKDLTKALNEVSTIIDNARSNINERTNDDEKMNILGRAYILNIDKFNNLKTLTRDYLEYKNGQINKGKTMNTRSKNRIEFANALENIIDNNPLRGKFDKSLEAGIIISRKQIEVLQAKGKNTNLSKAVSKDKNKVVEKAIEF